jgi:hypothetical protein
MIIKGVFVAISLLWPDTHSNNKIHTEPSLREKPLIKKLLIYHDYQGGFRGNLPVIAEYPLQQRNTH